MTRGQKLLLTLIVLSAALLRNPWTLGIYPDTYDWDEMFLTEPAEALGLQKQFRPRYVYYPAMSYYPHALVLAVAKQASLWHTQLRGTPLWNLDGPYRDHTQVRHLCRTTHGIIGTMTVLLTFVAGRRLYSTTVGLWAALLLAWMPYDVIRTQVIKPGTPASLWCVVALLGAIRVRDNPTLRNALLAGFLVGLPVAARYNSAPVAAFPLGVALMTSVLPRKRAIPYLAAAGVMSVVAFCLTNPWFLIEPEWYFNRIEFMLDGYVWRSELRGHGLGGIFAMVAKTLPAEWLLGWLAGGLFYLTLIPMAFDIVGGADRWLRLRGKASSHALVLSFALGYPIVHCLQSDLWLPHLLHLMFPFVALAAGHGAVRFYGWLDDLSSDTLRRIARPTAVVVSALLLYHGPSVIYHHNGILTTRAAAVEWATKQRDPGLTLSLDVDLPLTRDWIALDHLTAASSRLVDETRFVIIPRDVGRRAAYAQEPSATKALLFHPRVRFNGRIEPKFPTYTGDPVTVFRIEPADAPPVVADATVLGPGAWTMAGQPYSGREQSDGRWTVDPFLRDWGATDLSLAFADCLPAVADARVDLKLSVFCRSPECDPTLRLHLGGRVEELALRCDESWNDYTLSGLDWNELQDELLVIEPPLLGPDIVFVGALDLVQFKPFEAWTVADMASAGTLAVQQLGID